MRYGVLGGGALGLTLALRLVRRGHAVTVIERGDEAGGLAAGFRVGDAWLDKFYHHLFRSDEDAQALINEVGLGDRLVWPRPATVTLHGGRVYQLDSPQSLLRFTPLPPLDRVRMGAVLAYLRVERNYKRLEGQRAAPWIRRWMGEAAYRIVWEPLLRGKFGAVADEIALPWFWARVHCRSASLGYLRGGFQLLYERLVELIREGGGEVRLGQAVTRITRDAEGLLVGTTAGSERFDRVVSTLPTRLTCQLTPDLPADYRARYDWGRAYGAHCLILALDRPLTETYWMNINDPGFPFMALVEHTNYMPAADYGGRRLVYLGNYRPMDDPLFAKSKEEVLDEFLPHLTRINPAFERSWVTEAWSIGAPYAQPIVTVDYHEHIPPFDTPIPGLYVASMFQVYPQDRGQSYSIELANRLDRHLAATETP
jgi:protoporphyrinogen oxidase